MTSVCRAKTVNTVYKARRVKNPALKERTGTQRRRGVNHVTRCARLAREVEKRPARAVWRDCRILYLNAYPRAKNISIKIKENVICVAAAARLAKDQPVKSA